MNEVDPSPSASAPRAEPPSGATGGAPEAPALSRLRPFRRIALRSILGLTVVSAVLLAGVLLVMNTVGRRLLMKQSARRIEEYGNRSVEALAARTREVAALARTVARVSEELPRDRRVLLETLPRLIDFQGDRGVAGGGYWPEPGFFAQGVDRSSFFWGRNASGELTFHDDYNDQLGPGYRNEEWYVPARFLRPGAVFWSESYTDPYTYQPMVTCTATSYRDGHFAGAATIDVTLESLAALTERWGREAGGYAFLVDRNNRFLTYPQVSKMWHQAIDDRGRTTEAPLLAAELARTEPSFLPLTRVMEEMDLALLAKARSDARYDQELVEHIDRDSYAITRPEAELIVAGLADPLSDQHERTYLERTLALARDPLLGEASHGYFFYVPGSYWKLVLVMPDATAGAVASRISWLLVLATAPIVLLILLAAYGFTVRSLIRPVAELAAAASAVQEGRLDVEVENRPRNQVGALVVAFNQMIARLRVSTGHLREANQRLEHSLDLTRAILGTVHEGLFLVDADGRIEPGYSAALTRILGIQELAGRDFLELLGGLVSPRDQSLVERFLRILFDADKTDGLVAKANPLRQVEARLPGEDGLPTIKYLAFRFDRVRYGGALRHALVTVSDVTSKVELSRRLMESERKMQDQKELVASVLHVEPAMLSEFIDGVEAELVATLSLIARCHEGGEGRGQPCYQELLGRILKSVHTIKGTASMLGIEYFATTAHHFESLVLALSERVTLSAHSFDELEDEVRNMLSHLRETREIIRRFSDGHAPERVRSDVSLLTDVLDRYVQDLAHRHGRSASFTLSAEDSLRIPFGLKTSVRNVLSQLVRNAVVHGIEPPGERLRANKALVGKVEVRLARVNGCLEFAVRDDGRGIAESQLEPTRAECSCAQSTAERIFEMGSTSASQPGLDAGRGVGLTVVKDLVENLGGRVSVDQNPGHFCEFRVVLPVEPPGGLPS